MIMIKRFHTLHDAYVIISIIIIIIINREKPKGVSGCLPPPTSVITTRPAAGRAATTMAWWSRFLRSSNARQVARNFKRTPRLTPRPSMITRMWRRLRPDSARPTPSKPGGWRGRIRSLNKTGEVAKPARPKRAPDTLARSWRRLPFFRAWNRLRQGGGYRQQPATRAKAAGQAEAAGQAAAVEKGVLARAADALAADALAADAVAVPPPVSPAEAMAQWLSRRRRSEAGLAIEAAERASLARRALDFLTSRREELPSSAQGLLAPLWEAASARAAAAAEPLAGAARHVTAEVRRALEP